MIIVTGGAGFIGSNLVKALEERNYHEIVICDWLGTDDKWRNIAKRCLHDVIRPDELMAFLNKNKEAIEAIFHMGAISATTEKDGEEIVKNNFRLSADLFDWCAHYQKRLIYASSAATYGDGTTGFDDFEGEDQLKKLQPLNLYGWSKHAFDRRIAETKRLRKTLPRQCAGLKFFNVYGPNEYHKGDMASVVSKLYPEILKGQAAKLFKSHHPDYEDGGQLRDFVWVGDCINVMLWLYDHPEVSGLFNVGSGNARSFKDLAEATFKAAGLEPNIEYFDMPEHLRGKYQYFTEANLDKLRSYGFNQNMTSLEEGIRQYVQDYLAQEDRYA